ncbi:hypothetical protein CLOM_g16712 [Closterium sp. NIES-68]|nr:hypothetical protein CLOM_g16712 [Closterium sp. NIES-68]GJP82836.1 hypothetical protein CLOP_g13062 [Closterium sp. NIES-67]
MSIMELHMRPLLASNAPRPSLFTHRDALHRPSSVLLPRKIVNGAVEYRLGESTLARCRNHIPLQVSRRGQGHRVRCSASQKGPSSPAAGADDWVARHADALRLLPLAAGAAGGAVVLVNRVVWGIPAVADAGSAQARADVICLVLAASLVLSGLSWLALRPKPQTPVPLNGVPCHRILPSLPRPIQQELNWAWESLSFNTPCRSLVLIFKGQCILQAGCMAPVPSMPSATTTVDAAAAAVDAEKILSGSICSTALKSGRSNYLANLILFPARYELFQFLPDNTQAAIVQPVGDGDGVIVMGSDTIRGFTPLHQVWLGSIAEKLDASLSSFQEQGGL